MKLLKLKEGAEKFLNMQISNLIDFSLENNIQWSNNKYDAEREFHKIVQKEVEELLKTIKSKLDNLDLDYKKLEAEEWDFYFKRQEKRRENVS